MSGPSILVIASSCQIENTEIAKGEENGIEIVGKGGIV
jgi:hypothetical protein